MNKKFFAIITFFIILSSCSSAKQDTENQVNWNKKNITKEYTQTNSWSKADLDVENLNIQDWVTNLETPWGIVFLDEEKTLVSQRKWNILLIENWEIINENYWEADSNEIWEWWLMWIEKDPNFEQTWFIYVMYTYTDNSWELKNKVVRLVDTGNNSAEISETLIDNIPGSRFHNWWRLKFWPDDKLYIATWDASSPELAQDMDSLAWKILRINSDWTIPEDNPFEDSYIYTLGHRNPQWIATNPENWEMFISSHWPTWEFWLQNRDRFDHLVEWENYWWPEVTWYSDEYKDPLLYWPDVATPPAGMVFWGWYLFMTTLGRETLFQIDIFRDERWKYQAEIINELFVWEFWRLRDINVWPDWAMYLLTSNRDGRWNVRKWDDKIIRISK